MTGGSDKEITVKEDTDYFNGATRVGPEQCVKGDFIDADYPYVRPSYDSKENKITKKNRPGLIIYVERQQMVVAYITSKIPILLSPSDVYIPDSSPSFERTGLDVSSVIKLGVLATIPFEDVTGWRGSIDETLREVINSKIISCFRI